MKLKENICQKIYEKQNDIQFEKKDNKAILNNKSSLVNADGNTKDVPTSVDIKGKKIMDQQELQINNNSNNQIHLENLKIEDIEQKFDKIYRGIKINSNCKFEERMDFDTYKRLTKQARLESIKQQFQKKNYNANIKNLVDRLSKGTGKLNKNKNLLINEFSKHKNKNEKINLVQAENFFLKQQNFIEKKNKDIEKKRMGIKIIKGVQEENNFFKSTKCIIK